MHESEQARIQRAGYLRRAALVAGSADGALAEATDGAGLLTRGMFLQRSALIAVLFALALMTIGLPGVAVQSAVAQPEEFPLDSDKSPRPTPEGRQSPAPEEMQTAPQASAPSEVERAANESGIGLSPWLFPVLNVLAFLGGVFAAKAALRLTRKRREAGRGRQARVEPTPVRASTAEAQSLDRSSGAVAVGPAAVAMSAKGRMKNGSEPAAVESTPREQPTPSLMEPARAEQPSRDVAEPTRTDPLPEVSGLPQEAEESFLEGAEPTGAKEPSPDAVEPTETEQSTPEAPTLVEAEQPAPESTAAEKEPAPPESALAAGQEAKPEAPEPAQRKPLEALPDDVVPLPTRPGRIGRRSEPQRALGYVSAADADSRITELDTQTEQIRAAGVSHGYESVEVVRDFESHNGSDLERPGLLYAIERLEAGEAHALVVASLERLTRSAAHLGTLIDRLGASGIRLVVLDIELDTGDPDGRVAAEALANVGTLERKSLDQRTRKGLQAARDSRKSSGRPAVADRPALKDRIADMRARRLTLQAIADTLNAEGVPTLRGGAEWRPSSVQAAAGYKRPKRDARKPSNGSHGKG